MSQNLRLAFVNAWPKTTPFPAEVAFESRLMSVGSLQLFVPHQLANTSSRDAHITISYLIDALSSLPKRPDHAFDWAWRALENMVSASATGNITNLLRTEATPQIARYLLGFEPSQRAFFCLLESIPYQTCEYLFKKIVAGAPYSGLSTASAGLSKFAKRLQFENGSGPVISYPLLYFLAFISTRYDHADHKQRRKGVALLRLGLQGRLLVLEGASLQLSMSDRLFLLLSGLSYSFRNDRAHANSIAPFQSSLASIKTYAHCWFMFLFIYQCLMCYLKTRPDSPILVDQISANFHLNTGSFVRLFKSEIKQ